MLSSSTDCGRNPGVQDLAKWVRSTYTGGFKKLCRLNPSFEVKGSKLRLRPEVRIRDRVGGGNLHEPTPTCTPTPMESPLTRQGNPTRSAMQSNTTQDIVRHCTEPLSRRGGRTALGLRTSSARRCRARARARVKTRVRVETRVRARLRVEIRARLRVEIRSRVKPRVRVETRVRARVRVEIRSRLRVEIRARVKASASARARLRLRLRARLRVRGRVRVRSKSVQS